MMPPLCFEVVLRAGRGQEEEDGEEGNHATSKGEDGPGEGRGAVGQVLLRDGGGCSSSRRRSRGMTGDFG